MEFGRKIEITEKKILCNHKIDEKKCRVLEMENTPLLKVNLQEINFLRKKLKENNNNKLDEEKNIYKAKPIIATRRGNIVLYKNKLFLFSRYFIKKNKQCLR